MYESVKIWTEPLTILDEAEKTMCGMTNKEIGFLCGLIKEHRPRKLLELGVAQGGTTSIIMNALMKIECECQVISVDISRNVYNDNSKQTGYILNELKTSLNNLAQHRFILGHTIAEVVDDIGSSIDFVVLDAAHVMPGELLDFLIIYPHLSHNAIVVLHDVNESNQHFVRSKGHYQEFLQSFSIIATSVLFSTVKAVKYYNSSSANIAAFKVDNNTKTYLIDCFFALTNTWRYNYLPVNILKIFRKQLTNYYDDSHIYFFDLAVRQNQFVNSKLRFGGVEGGWSFISNYLHYTKKEIKIPRVLKVLWKNIFSKIYIRLFVK